MVYNFHHYYLLKYFKTTTVPPSMPTHSRSKLASAKTSAKKWIKSMKSKGYNNIICYKCTHTQFSNVNNILQNFVNHILECDPSRVKWCSVCKTHSTTSKRNMEKHLAKAHPCYLKFEKLFKI